MKKVNRLFKKVISTLSAVILATAGAGSFSAKSNASYDDPDFVELAEQVIVLVNEARAEEGLDPITLYLISVMQLQYVQKNALRISATPEQTAVHLYR